MFKNFHKKKFSKMKCFIFILTRISESEPYSCQGEEIIIANTYLTLGMCQAVHKAIHISFNIIFIFYIQVYIYIIYIIIIFYIIIIYYM